MQTFISMIIVLALMLITTTTSLTIVDHLSWTLEIRDEVRNLEDDLRKLRFETGRVTREDIEYASEEDLDSFRSSNASHPLFEFAAKKYAEKVEALNNSLVRINLVDPLAELEDGTVKSLVFEVDRSQHKSLPEQFSAMLTVAGDGINCLNCGDPVLFKAGKQNFDLQLEPSTYGQTPLKVSLKQRVGDSWDEIKSERFDLNIQERPFLENEVRIELAGLMLAAVSAIGTALYSLWRILRRFGRRGVQ